ncbi:MAG: alpha/beta hydrolase domain-containing protein [Actinomycetota bacterium]
MPAKPRNAVVAVPTVSAPVTGGRYGVPANPAPPEVLERAGYREIEYFVSGTATSYTAPGSLGSDGDWTVTPGATAPYITRIIVRRPRDPARFSGTVAVEWMNVTAGRDSDPEFGYLLPALLRDGDAYVAVSAQKIGVEGGGGLEVPGVPPEALLALKQWDPQRYAGLRHPGDEWSYDIFSQAAQALLAPGTVDPLDGLRPRTLLAVGQSQSAGTLATYVNAIQPITGMFDGFLLDGRGQFAGGLDGPDGENAVPRVVRLRPDGDAPVLQFETETDLGFLGFIDARQPDGPNLVTWEVAGTAHADASTLVYGEESARVWYDGPPVDLISTCGTINDGPHGAVLRAAYSALGRWVAGEGRPPASPRLATGPTGEILTDADGNARGGIRTPAVDAPTATIIGKGNPVSIFCSLFGQEIPFPAARLAERYADHDAYVAAVTRSADAAVAAGFLLRPERDEIVAEAEAADIPARS